MTTKWGQIAVFSLLILAIALLAYISVYQIGTKGSECTLEPLNYAYRALSDANPGKTLICSCQIIGQGSSAILEFNETDVYPANRITNSPQETEEETYNFSEFEDLFAK